ncbi:MAG: hypothetical protein IPO74_09245 [Thermomonas sp.]|uniref:response regulator transcription factor n=1 Tax=Thermomonas sp. TaxID=1971895 RepID=UPI001B61881A|nr:hypothetical protein [Thermomonas sp.]MBP7788109.1 hypothetical protein [Thermomonas sp.]MBP8615593.1 hypothetical protein [Thermomonas sp.]
MPQLLPDLSFPSRRCARIACCQRAGIAIFKSILSSDLQQPAAPRAGLESLSEREQEVFLRLARGETPKQAAIDMGISDKTVYLHRASLRAKLGVNNDLALHKLALERGLLG